MSRIRQFFSVLGQSRRVVALVWSTSRPLTVALGVLTAAAGTVPAVIAYVAARIVDTVLADVQGFQHGVAVDTTPLLVLIGLEATLAAMLAAVQRAVSFCQSLLRAKLSQHVNELIFRKTLTLEQSQFEDSEFFDKLSRAHRGAASRPLSLVMRLLSVAQGIVTLAGFATLLVQFSP
ncbi:MAG: hypothetical protein ACREVW_07490, partial [Burkholderiales bacterium]